MENKHEPVLVNEVVNALLAKIIAHSNNKSLHAVRIIDATEGFGGHSSELLKHGVDLLGIDADKNALKNARKKLDEACPPNLSKKIGSFKLVHGNFLDIDKIAKEYGFAHVNGVLFDLGVSSLQLLSETRGFSFSNKSAKLDMRLDKEGQNVTASDLLNGLPKTQLVNLFSEVLGRGESLRLASEIVKFRKSKKIKTVGDFLQILTKTKSTLAKSNLHFATKPFLALRMAVNSEIENLKLALPKAFELLIPGGRLVVISFHSGEDRVVKRFYKNMNWDSLATIVNKKPIVPSESEKQKNPRSRSAKLRILEKV